ncbi:MAG: discoidin domain-containing protein, partial [Planctomycetes bacterium]|nr:discoidin domain-containing protein [Planctomycetota bacterium]
CHNDRSSLPWLAETRSQETGTAKDRRDDVAFSLLSTTTTDWVAKRRFSDAYLALTGAVWGYDRSLEGTSRPLVNWTSPQSGPSMRPPYNAGSATSDLMTLLEEGHKGVRLNREETEKLACWIDLVVPYCGDYFEANAWMPFERAHYDRFLAKRNKMEAIEDRNISQLLSSQERGGTGMESHDEPAAALTLTTEVTSADGEVLVQRQASVTPRSSLVVDMPRPLQAGDRICARGPRHLAVQFDPKLGERLVYSPDGSIEWTVPADQEPSGKSPYPPSTFRSERPRLSLRPVALAELDAYRNIAANPYDLRGSVGTFPHATAGSQYGNEPFYAARNAIDDQRPNDSHGDWPCPSWDAGQTEDPWWQVEFGRVLEIDKVVIVLRADSSDDNGWHRATLIFSNGNRRTIDLANTAEPQTFTFEAHKTSSLRLAELVQGDQPGRCGLTEVEVWGRDRIPVAEDLSAPAP